MVLPVDPGEIRALADGLIAWFEQAKRELPWRSSAPEDPYAVLVREVMLQQTQVETALPYLERWLDRWPTIEALAKASEDDVLDAWQGLGYYNRARWLLRAARQVVDAHDGELPSTPGELEELTGVGPYTAAAIASMAHGIPAVPVDGNVARVGARVAGIEGDPTRTTTKRAVADALEPLVRAAEDPATAAEALIELGALVCTPKAPDCQHCPLATACTARRQNRIHELPEPVERPSPSEHLVVALLVETDAGVLVRKRSTDGLLGGLWGLPMVEREGDEPRERTAMRVLGASVEFDEQPLVSVEHAFTHKRWRVHVHLAHLRGDPPKGPRWRTVERDRLEDELNLSTLDRKVLDALAQTRLTRWA